MELSQAIKGRHSVRRFEEKPIAHEVIEEIVDLARFAPSWKNTQIARYIIVEDREKIEALASDLCTYGFSYNAKTILSAQAVCILTYVKNRSGFDSDGSFSTPKGDRWESFDCGLFAGDFVLAAHEKGIGTVILGYFDEEEIKKHISVPENQGIGCIIPMGYPKFPAEATPRKEVSELLSFE